MPRSSPEARGRRIILLCPANRKAAGPRKAIELYRSPLFYAGRSWALRMQPDMLMLMSVRHGLVPADDMLEPYPDTLSGMDDAAVEQWADRIAAGLRDFGLAPQDELIILGLSRFAAPLLKRLPQAHAPLLGMTLPEARHWLQQT
jgi:hypothetical protein